MLLIYFYFLYKYLYIYWYATKALTRLWCWWDELQVVFKDWSLQCPSNAIWPFKIYLLSKQPFKMQPQIENEDLTWSPQYNMPTSRTSKRGTMSLQEVELDGWFYWKHVPHNSCTSLIWVLYFHFYILGLTSWIWTSLSTEGLKCENPSKWNSYEDFNLEDCLQVRPWGRCVLFEFFFYDSP